mmetsp:Transcript_93050/g.259238  ORF Transcript_93050/g.259238 Transcript_93050/m.259238 type:complete len:112 (-) Transcript_93050:134-469(-)
MAGCCWPFLSSDRRTQRANRRSQGSCCEATPEGSAPRLPAGATKDAPRAPMAGLQVQTTCSESSLVGKTASGSVFLFPNTPISHYTGIAPQADPTPRAVGTETAISPFLVF